jgi:AcrR family transcriptional regulator
MGGRTAARGTGVEGGRIAVRRAELRRRVLAASLDLFGKRGISSTPMSELITAADTSAGAFYGLFESKDALVQALIEEAIDPVADAIDELGSNEADPVMTLGLGLRTALAVAMRNTDWGHFVGQSMMLNYALERGFRPRVTRDIRRAQRDGRLPPLDELVAVALMLGAFQAGVTLANQGLLSDRIACNLTERMLVAIGADADTAWAVATRPLPPITVQSEIDLN